MASQTSISNRALLEMGQNPISSVDDGSKAANIIKEVWEDLTREILESHTWKFAKKWANVASDAAYTMVDEDWDYAYAVPSDYVRMSKTEDNETVKFARRGAYLLTNEESPFKFEYIQYISDTTLWPQHFINAMVARLQSVLATPLSTKSSKMKNKDYLEIYHSIVLPAAKTRDAEESFGEPDDDKGKHTESNDSWLSSR